MTSQRSSICSLGVAVEFFWVRCADGLHIEAAVDALWEALMAKPGRLRNPYVEAMVRAEFRDRLDTATRGELEPIEQVKSIEGYPTLDMFEIRWPGISVRERDPASQQQRGVVVEMRLYYVELSRSLSVLGCHVHEKWVDGGKSEIRDRQNAEIDRAVLVYSDGFADTWGVPELLD